MPDPDAPQDSRRTANHPPHPGMWDGVLVPVHKAGYPFIAGAVILTLILLAVSLPLGLLAAIGAGWVIYFFRDPPRMIPQEDSLILSPADGRIQSIGPAARPPELAPENSEDGTDAEFAQYTRISVFLNIFDVHVNRIPAGGTVGRVVYTPGKFVNAALDKASTDNERSSFTLRLADGREMIVSQIAGLVARRILCDVQDGQTVTAGARFGIIRFGSRVDVYLPEGAVPRVAVGQRAIGGETVLAELDGGRNSLQARQD